MTEEIRNHLIEDVKLWMNATFKKQKVIQNYRIYLLKIKEATVKGSYIEELVEDALKEDIG